MTTARTPTSSSAVRPPREEMHPSKVHQSTAKQVDSGLVLGFKPIKRDSDGKVLNFGTTDTTPSKSKPSPAPNQFGTPGYDIKFGQESQLSDEAKQLVDRVREEAKQIKEKMLFEKSQQDKKDDAAELSFGERKFAQPKGRAGRFSDVHMAEFKKMDSIANHASSFRGTPGRFQPVTKSLKRTKSKAQLDEPEPQDQSPSRSSSSTKPPTTITTPIAQTKRTKFNPTEEAPSSTVPAEKKQSTVQKPVARAIARPTGPRPTTQVRSSLMTPTRASIARNTSGSLSLKAPKTSLIPSLARSPSTQGLASPRTPRTDFNPRIKSNLPTLGHLKSILRKRQPLFSKDPSKIAAGTHVAAPDFKPGSLFSSSVNEDKDNTAPTPSPKKHVAFTPSVRSRYEETQVSPSRSKITTPTCPDLSEVTYPTLPTLTPEAKAISEDNNAAHAQSPTIRHVRKSNISQDAVYPELDVTEVPVVAHGIAHGIGNKKRHRDEVDDHDVPNSEDRENVPPADALSGERSKKRLKSGPNPPTPSPVKNRPIKTPVRSASKFMGTPGSVTASGKKSRSVLSLSRLNMLAKPKGRA